jgi:hypothetical protein
MTGKEKFPSSLVVHLRKYQLLAHVRALLYSSNYNIYRNDAVYAIYMHIHNDTCIHAIILLLVYN